MTTIVQTLESDVIAVIAKLKAGVTVIDQDLLNAWSWVCSHMGDIAADFQELLAGLQAAQAAGLTLPASVITAVNSANSAVAAMNSMVTATNAGANAVTVLVDGYTAAKQAQGAVAAGGLAIATAPAASAAAATTAGKTMAPAAAAPAAAAAA